MSFPCVCVCARACAHMYCSSRSHSQSRPAMASHDHSHLVGPTGRSLQVLKFLSSPLDFLSLSISLAAVTAGGSKQLFFKGQLCHSMLRNTRNTRRPTEAYGVPQQTQRGPWVWSSDTGPLGGSLPRRPSVQPPASAPDTFAVLIL